MMAAGPWRRAAAPLVIVIALVGPLAHAAPPQPILGMAAKRSPAAPTTACALCSVLALADEVIFATPPLLRLPEVVEFLYRTTDAEFVHLKSTGSAPSPAARHDS